MQTEEIASLKHKLEEFADYDEVKRELDIMKASIRTSQRGRLMQAQFIEFSGTSLEDDAEDDNSDSTSFADSSLRMPNPNGDKSRGRGKPLENLLLSKNRKMQEQLTTLRVAHEELTAATEGSRRRIAELQAQVESQRALNDRLENDLVRLNKSHGESDANATSKDGLSSLGLGKRVPSPKPPQPSTVPAGLTSAAETSILPIITSQRDRFRQRNSELEEVSVVTRGCLWLTGRLQELRKQQSITQEVKNESKALQADNLKLYEKVRYLQSYRDDAGSTSKSLYPAAVGKEKDDQQLGKYRSMYEQSMNPFEAFRGRASVAKCTLAQLTPFAGTVVGRPGPQSDREDAAGIRKPHLGQSSHAHPFRGLCCVSAHLRLWDGEQAATRLARAQCRNRSSSTPQPRRNTWS
jgi:homeobox protein cut-like